MRILYISKASRVAAYRDKLAVMGRKVDLTLVTPQKWGRDPDEPLMPGDPPTLSLPAPLHGHNHFHFYRGLAQVMDRARPDLVHADEEPYSAVTGQIAWLCAQRRVPFVFFAWQNIRKRLPPPFGALRTWVFRRAAGGIAGTETAGAVLRHGGFSGPLAVIPQMGVDPSLFRPDPDARVRVRARLALDERALLVAFVGRLVPEKGVDLLLTALTAVEGATLLVLGAGPERERLDRRARDLGLDARVRFVGPAVSSEIPEWMAAVDILALPSLTTPGWSEQFGRVLVEAMATGVPVVGSDSGEIASVIGDAGLVVPEGDPRALGDALLQLAGSAARRAELGRLGRARSTARFTNGIIADRTVQFYEQLLGAGIVA